MKNLTQNEEYARKVLPFLSDSYFTDRSEKLVFQHVKEFILQYNALPTLEALHININNLPNLKEEEIKSAINVIGTIEDIKEEKSEQQWLVDKTEKFSYNISLKIMS